MKIYTGTSWNKENIQKCIEYDIGWCSSPQDPIQPKNIDPRINFIYDNGAFAAFRTGKTIDLSLFYSRLDEMEREPEWVCVPDVVGEAEKSYDLSTKNIEKIPFKKYFVVQDGMYFDAVYHAVARCDGVFVGGSIKWKWKTACHWITHAHEIGLPCHIGRVGRFLDYDRSHVLGADSVDGSTIIRHNLLERVPLFRKHAVEQQRWEDYREENLVKSVLPSDELEGL